MKMQSPFLIFSHPRSRSKWLSVFLSVDPWVCGHDVAIDLPDLDKLAEFYSLPNTGSAETGAAEMAPLFLARFPNARVVVVRRPIDEVASSLSPSLGREINPQWLAGQETALDEIEKMPGVLSVQFSDLEKEGTCRSIWEHCLPGQPFDHNRWERMAGQNIQIDMRERICKLAENQAALDRLKTEARIAMKHLPYVFLRERVTDSLCDEVECLIQAHHDQLGEFDAELGFDPDYEKAIQLEQSGIFRVVTARHDGKLVGYCCFLVHNSLEHKTLKVGTQAMWFVSDEHRRGAGKLLMTESLRRLKEEGVKVAYPHHRVFGGGEHVAVLMKRLGAKPLELSYSLQIGDL